MKHDLAKISSIYEIQFTVKIATLSRLANHNNDLINAYTRLEDSRYTIPNDVTEPTIRRDANEWEQWINMTQGQINIERYSLGAKIEIVRREAQISFGHKIAMMRLQKWIKNKK